MLAAIFQNIYQNHIINQRWWMSLCIIKAVFDASIPMTSNPAKRAQNKLVALQKFHVEIVEILWWSESSSFSKRFQRQNVIFFDCCSPDKMIFNVKYALCWHSIYFIGSSDSIVNWILFASRTYSIFSLSPAFVGCIFHYLSLFCARLWALCGCLCCVARKALCTMDVNSNSDNVLHGNL